jgi:hypothetical protein
LANTNTPFGLKPWRGGAGYAWNEQGTTYSIPSGDTNAYYLYDAVKGASGSDANGIPNCVYLAAGTDPIRGSIIGIIQPFPNPVSITGVPLQLEYPYIPATKASAYYVLVCDDPTVRYVIQDDGITTANFVSTSANKNSSLTLAAGAAPQNYSGTVLLSSSFATTSTLNIKLEGLVQIPGNTYAAYAKWQAMVNYTDMALGATGATGV